MHHNKILRRVSEYLERLGHAGQTYTAEVPGIGDHANVIFLDLVSGSESRLAVIFDTPALLGPERRGQFISLR